MKTTTLGVFGLGVFGGAAVAFSVMASGCFLPWLATARADDVVTMTCTKAGQLLEYTLPDESPETLARLSIVSKGTAAPMCSPDSGKTMRWAPASAADGKVTIPCAESCPDGRNVTVSFVMR